MTPGLLVALAFSIAGAAPEDEGAGGYLQPTVSYHGLRVLGFTPEETQGLQANFAARVGAARPIRLGNAATEIAEQCQADVYCHCREARQAKATHALWGNVGRLDRLHTLELVLLDAQDCTIANSAFSSQILEDRELAPRMEDLLSRALTPKETVSQAAVKQERPQQDVPAVVTVFTQAQIRRLGVTRVEELFRLVPGFEVLETNSASSVVHNGMGGTVLFMIDGVPLSHALFNVLFIGQDLRFNVETLERVEFVRGPLGVLWGPYALLGVVNFVTRAPESEKLQVWAQGRGGTLDTQEAAFALSQRTPHISYSVTAAVGRTRGPVTYVPDSLHGFGGPDFDVPVWGNAGFSPNPPDTYLDLSGKAQLFSDRLTLSIVHTQFENRYGISPRGGLMHSDTDGYFRRSIRVYSAAFEDELPAGFRYRLSLSQSEHILDESFVSTPGAPDGTVEGVRFVQGNPSEPLISRNAEARLHHDRSFGPARSAALLGFAYLGQRLPNVYSTAIIGDEPAGVPNLDISARRFQTFAGFLQEDVTLFDRVTLSAGIRYEHRAPFASFLGKQAAIIGKLPLDLRGKVIYSEGFRPPETNDLFSTQGIEGNPELRPEKSRALSAELAGERAGVNGRVSGAVGELFDLIAADPTAASPGFDFRPINRATIGYIAAQAEVSTSHPIGDVFLNYAFKRLNESDAIGSGIAVAPHTASVGVSARPFNDVSAFATGFWVSPRRVSLRTVDGLTETTIPSTFGFDGGVRVSNVWNKVTLELLLKNPLGLEQRVPYRLTGFPNMLIERRVARELLVGLRVAL